MMDEIDDTRQIPRLPLPGPPVVLLVDDDELVLARLRELVTAAGYDARTASGSIEALASLEENPASIVVTDLNMPHMNGLELCRRIRERPSPRYVYIVLLTVRDEEKDILAGLEAGADDYLNKRTSPAQFTARLRIARRVLELEHSLRVALERKHQQAITDVLTGAYNRRYFLRHLARELKRSKRAGGEVALLLLDVDHFKEVNDRHGHLVGDAVLQSVTGIISRCLQRETDWCARLGGDEFAVVLEGTNTRHALECAEGLRQAIALTAMDTPAGTLHVTVSIGVCGLDSSPTGLKACSVHSMLGEADTQLYAVKRDGRNRVAARGAYGQFEESAGPSAGIPEGRSKHVQPKAALGAVR